MSSSTKVKQINPDIAKERKTATFDTDEFAAFFNGGADFYKILRKMDELLASDPGLEDNVPYYYLSYKDLYNNNVRKFTRFAKVVKDFSRTCGPYEEDVFPLVVTGQYAQSYLSGASPLSVHFYMFIPAIENQGTPEQVSKWLPRAKNCDILGTYAQTELGHGTYIRGLQTRADYDPKTEEFILNTPSLTAYKWWPASLGHTANYGIIVAQLYVKDKNHGIQMFIVQFRDEETHMPMPGITAGDIGNKLSFKGVNNGYMALKNVRIPRMNMLMRYTQVHPDGTVVKSPNSVVSYWTMVYVRIMVPKEQCHSFGAAATIATRYSAIRRQSTINPNEPECQIIDHLTQQLKVFPEIAKAVVFRCVVDHTIEMYHEVSKDIKADKYDQLPEIHAIASCLKSIVTADVSSGAEVLRMACGGHGFMLSSNMPDLYGVAAAAATYEGENTVMLLQTAGVLIKAWNGASSGMKLPPTMAYFAEVQNNNKLPKWDGSILWIIKALQFSAANKIKIANEQLFERVKKGMTEKEAANATSIELAQAADLHGRALLVSIGYQKIVVESDGRSASLNAVLRDLLDLYVIVAGWRNMADILRFTSFSETDLRNLQTKLEQALQRIRPNAVAIVDGFGYHDRVLNSVLGHYDGNVYERIFEMAQKNPMNQVPVQTSYQQYLRPFLKANL